MTHLFLSQSVLLFTPMCKGLTFKAMKEVDNIDRFIISTHDVLYISIINFLVSDASLVEDFTH